MPQNGATQDNRQKKRTSSREESYPGKHIEDDLRNIGVIISKSDYKGPGHPDQDRKDTEYENREDDEPMPIPCFFPDVIQYYIKEGFPVTLKAREQEYARLSENIVDGLEKFAQGKGLEEQIGPENALEFRNIVNTFCTEYYAEKEYSGRDKLMVSKLESLKKWVETKELAEAKERKPKNLAWKKIGSAIFSGIKAVISCTHGNIKDAKKYYAQMIKSFKELSLGEKKDIVSSKPTTNFKPTKDKIKSFTQKINKDRKFIMHSGVIYNGP